MPYTVTVSFGPNSEYDFKFLDAEVQQLVREDASRWLQQEFDTLDCSPRNPVGKILLLDVILDVARYGGESRFAAVGDWARHFALCCAATLKRETIRVDVPNLVIG